MRGFDACPFCRELFTRGEHRACPVCHVALVPADKLGDAPDDAPVPSSPADERLPFFFVGRGRGALVALSAAGVAAFFAPWVYLVAPDRLTLSGAAVAARQGYQWSVMVAWFTLAALALSRRTIRQMRGVRHIATVLGLIPAVVAGVLLALPPPSTAEARGIVVHLRFGWAPGLYATFALGLVAGVVAALRFGGRPDIITVSRGTSSGETVH